MPKDRITVLISSSPIQSHPSIEIIEKTIDSIRFHLRTARIIIMLDGVRPEQDNYTDRYLKYQENLIGYTMFAGNITLAPFIEFTHQARMTIKTLELVDTPYILFVEHDTPLLERPIDWNFLQRQLKEGTTNHIRLHYDEQIHPEHQHLMCGKIGNHLIKTIQWHQRPHVANRDWYDEKLRQVFTPRSRTFIEDRMYTFCENSPWEDFKLTIYDPEGDGTRMKRSGDLNGRGTDLKYSMVF